MTTTAMPNRTRRAEPRLRTARCRARTQVRPVGVVVFEIVLLVVIIVALAAGVVMTSGRVHAQAPTMLVFVEPGQTLWSIAAQHPVDGQTTEQTADMIAEINRVQGGRVMAGDTIAVPVHGDDQLLTASR